MNVLVDTSVWSAALRRHTVNVNPLVAELQELIKEGRAVIVGPIRQELLSGIKEREQFRTVRDRLRDFPDVRIGPTDYESAAEMYNLCRARGVQGSAVDFLLCAIAVRDKLTIFTSDQDFAHFSQHLPIQLHVAR